MALDEPIVALKVLKPAAKLIPVAGPYLEGAVDLLLEGCIYAQDAKKNKEDLLRLGEHAARCMIIIIEKTQEQPESEVKNRIKTIRDLERLTEELQRKTKEWAQRRFISRFKSTPQVKGAIEDLSSRFGQIVERFGIEAQLIIMYDINDVLGRVKKLQDAQTRTEQNALLDKLRPISIARHDHQRSPRGCTVGTRIDIINRIFKWSLNKATPEDVLWLSGLGGTGKTAIMKTLSIMLAEEGVLGGCFFISHQFAETQNPQNVFRSLTYQLAEFQPAFREPICSVLRNYPAIVDQEMAIQIRKLLSEAFAEVQYETERPIVIMIDGLDECEKEDDVEGGQLLPILLDMMLQHPKKLKPIVASRLIPTIEEMFVNVTAKQVRLHEEDLDTVVADIRLYLETELQQITQKKGLVADPSWYTAADIAKLVASSGNLFIYAFTVVTWINSPRIPPKDRLRQLLEWRSHSSSKSPYARLDDFYKLILQTALGSDPNDRKEIGERMRLLLEILVVAFRPLPVPELAALLGCDQTYVRLDLDQLSAVLLVPEKGSTNPVMVYHASFIEYMTNPDRCSIEPPLYVLVWEAHGRTGLRCLDLRYTDHKRASSRMDSRKNAENAVNYASEHWFGHLHLSPTATTYVPQAIGEVRQMVSTQRKNTSFLFDLSHLLNLQSDRIDGVEIIHEKISIDRRLLASASSSDQSRCKLLNSLASGVQSLYERNGQQELLDEAVELYRQALELRPPGHPNRDISLNNLAGGLKSLYARNGQQELLDEAVELYRQALELCPPGHPTRDTSLNNLAVGLKSLYARNGQQELLDEAVELLRQALELCPPGHPNRDTSLNNLAAGLDSLYARNGQQELLDEAVELLRQALELRPLGHPTRATSLNNLAHSLRLQCTQTNDTDLAKEAFQLSKEAISLCSPTHISRYVNYLGGLAESLDICIKVMGD